MGALELAIDSYDEVLRRDPGCEAAAINRDLIAAIRAAPKEQEEEQNDPNEPTFAADDVVFDDKGKEGSLGEVPVAAELTPSALDAWMRQVETRPGDFLRTKFAIQAGEQDNEPNLPTLE